jgi:hypothetical protein
MTDPPTLEYAGDGAERQLYVLIHDTLFEMPIRNEACLMSLCIGELTNARSATWLTTKSSRWWMPSGGLHCIMMAAASFEA